MMNASGLKSQSKLICILAYTKWTKTEKFYSIQIWTIHYKIYQLLFFCSLEYEAVCIEILHH
jgi:hypothetical protein